jgi:hypothetical protein
MSLSDDPLNNVSPKTRQRYESALARRRSKERGFQKVSPFSVARHIEASAPQEQINESHAWAHEAPAPQEQGSANQAWIHWEYNPEEWAHFEKIDWKSVRRTYWLLVGLCFPFFCDLIVIIWVSIFLLPSPAFEHFPTVPLLFPLGYVLFLLLSLVPLIVLSSYSYLYDQAKRRHKARQQDRFHRVTIAKEGVWEAGAYIPFDVLKEVTMTPQPPALHFRRGKSLLATRNAPLHNTFHVIVPRGHEEEAAHLVQRFRTEVIEAREQAWQRSMNPPEPL